MDINYFLFFKKMYTSMVANLNCIIESCDEIIDVQENHNIGPFIFKKDEIIKRNCILERIEILELINICNSHIKKLCKHEFINDNIDIDLDNSQEITYCKLCELSEEYCKAL
jgi:hypothetical protein